MPKKATPVINQHFDGKGHIYKIGSTIAGMYSRDVQPHEVIVHFNLTCDSVARRFVSYMMHMGHHSVALDMTGGRIYLTGKAIDDIFNIQKEEWGVAWDGFTSLLCKIAEHPNVFVKTLRKLTKANNCVALRCVIRNPKTPLPLLCRLRGKYQKYPSNTMGYTLVPDINEAIINHIERKTQ